MSRQKAGIATYFIIEPYVYISLKSTGVFLYNTLNRKSILHRSPDVIKLVKRLTRGNRPGLIKLQWPRVKRDKVLVKFIKKARTYFMGDLLHLPESAEAPVQLMPMAGLPDLAGEGMSYLRELTLFVNNDCDLDCDICSGAGYVAGPVAGNLACRQFPCCYRSPSQPGELSIEAAEKALLESNTPGLNRITITGGNILKYKAYDRLIDGLKRCDSMKSLLIHYLNLHTETGENPLPAHPSFFYHILVTFPLKKKRLGSVLSRLKNKGHNFKVDFIIQSETQFMLAREFIETSNEAIALDRFSFSPYWNGRNLTFFKKFVYIKKQGLFDSNPSIPDIFARGVINHNSFGHLTVWNNGEVFANINERPLGNIAAGSVAQMVNKALKEKNGWMKTREMVAPCRDCFFSLLCPSISNYEYAAGKNNLCTICK